MKNFFALTQEAVKSKKFWIVIKKMNLYEEGPRSSENYAAVGKHT